MKLQSWAALAAILSSSVAAAAPTKFDLVCEGTREVHKGYGSTSEPYQAHYVVDLTQKIYCRYSGERDCSSVQKIYDFTPSKIQFKYEDPRYSTQMDTDEVSRSSGEALRAWVGDGEGVVEQGKCKPAPFSGFPKAQF